MDKAEVYGQERQIMPRQSQIHSRPPPYLADSVGRHCMHLIWSRVAALSPQNAAVLVTGAACKVHARGRPNALLKEAVRRLEAGHKLLVGLAPGPDAKLRNQLPLRLPKRVDDDELPNALVLRTIRAS